MTRLLVGLLVCGTILWVALLRGADLREAHPGPSSAAHDIISETKCDIDGDGVLESIQIAIVDGTRYTAPEYCGGGDTWEGHFQIGVIDDGRLLSSTSLNTLMGADSLSFWGPVFRVEVGDYNADGRLDFNLLSSYGNCNGSEYRLFTVDSRGAVGCLSDQSFYALPPHTNSSPSIKGNRGLLTVAYYSQLLGDVSDSYEWIDDGWNLVRSDTGSDSIYMANPNRSGVASGPSASHC
jgi:hypothetical protein